MASDHTLDFPRFRAAEQTWLPRLSFLALLVMIFVGLDAFSPPPDVAQFGGVNEASHGDLIRQITYLALGALIGLAAIQQRGLTALRAVPISMWILLAWCAASAFWAPLPTLVLRRAGLEVVLVSSLFLGLETLGAEQSFAIWRWLLAAVLVVNFLSIPLVESARHGAGEIDSSLVGNWRGLYGHKNVAGAVCAITAILFLFSRNGWRNWIGVVVALCACIFLAMSHSKSSAGFLVIALLAGLFYRIGWRDGLSRAILTAFVSLLVVVAISYALLDADVIARSLEDPAEFTGRSEIWAAELRYIGDHPLLGAGFGTFTDTGSQSPLHNYVSGSWVDAVSHGHNGYLQLLVTVGGTGFLLAMLALLVLPSRHFWSLDQRDSPFKSMLLALFVFGVLHNFMESDFLEGDDVVWVALLLVIAGVYQTGRLHSLTGR